ncbi:hypothetical protein IKI14_06160 [bacterium]|nr:hypothetical protein [bacterium]
MVSIVRECTDANQNLFQTFQADSSTLDSIAESLQSNIEICNNAKAKALEL